MPIWTEFDLRQINMRAWGPPRLPLARGKKPAKSLMWIIFQTARRRRLHTEKTGVLHMKSISTLRHENCPRCGSGLVSLEWDERVNAREIQDLWHCWNCKNEFITTITSDDKGPSLTEITKPFFTSLVME